MKSKAPKTRIEADAPKAVAHLSDEKKRALEVSAEAEHATGPRRERLIKTSQQLSEKRSS